MDMLSVSGFGISAVLILLAILFAAKKRSVASGLLSLISAVPCVQYLWKFGISSSICAVLGAVTALMCVITPFAHATPWLHPYAAICCVLSALWLTNFEVDFSYFLGGMGIVLAIYMVLLLKGRKQKTVRAATSCASCPYAAKCAKGKG